MTYNEATLRAVTGEKLILPGWQGYFYWNYGTHQLEFRNGDYHLSGEELQRFELNKRTDWYYII